MAESLEYQIAKLTLAPGDTVVIKSNEVISLDDANKIEAGLRKVFPQEVHILILDSAFDLSVLRGYAVDADKSE